MSQLLLKLLLIAFLYIFSLNLGAQEFIPLNSGWQVLEKSFNPTESLEPVLNPDAFKWKELSSKKISANSNRNDYTLIRIPIPDNHLQEPAIFISKIIFPITIYFKGKEIYKFYDSSVFDPGKFMGWISHLIPIPENVKNKYIYISVYTEISTIMIVPILGCYHEILVNKFVSNLPGIAVVVISLLMGLAFLGTFLIRKSDKFSLSLAIFFIFISIWLFNINYISQWILPLTPNKLRLEYISMYIAPFGLVFFITNIFRSKLNVVFMAFGYIFLMYAFFALLFDVTGLFPIWKTLIPFDITLCVSMLLYIYQIVRFALQKNIEARILAVGIILLALFAVHDVLIVFAVISGSMLMHLGILFFFLSMSGVALYRVSELYLNLERFSKELQVKNKSLRELNVNLESKVIERTREVTEKMEQINALNIQQTGDYFLTSLIQIPLTRNDNTSKLVQTQFHIEQKKKFEFHNKNSDLGGDICITSTLHFPDRSGKYIFFFNGDAMGKSMQGAGGAIVAGTVINSILTSFDTSVSSKLAPREWLLTTCKEIDNIFLTFDGSMLLSGVLGLIHETTGELWYANAEHPKTVLFRDYKASYLDLDENSFLKFGCGIMHEFTIQHFELHPGDILICGSDGRDDLDISETTDNKRSINYDDTLFLRIVEFSRADLPKIVSNIKQAGKITDDLSLMKIKYHVV
jgi:hypothetical protein